MPTLEEIRARMAEAKHRPTTDLRAGELAGGLKGAMDVIRERYLAESCPACGGSTPVELGFRHGGVHQRCNVCTFEFTRKTFDSTQAEDLKRHIDLVCNAAVRFTHREIAAREKAALYAAALRERRAKYTLLTLPNGDMDATLHFGQFKDRTISELGETVRGRSYLRWMLGADFEDELRAVINLHIEGTDGH